MKLIVKIYLKKNAKIILMIAFKFITSIQCYKFIYIKVPPLTELC